jgi:glucokinase
MEQDWLLGIEIGGTKLQLGLGREGGRIEVLERLRIEPQRGSRAILDQIRCSFASLTERASVASGSVRAVGVGFGGPVDVAQGRVQTSYQVGGWTDFPLADWLRENLGVRAVRVENDADAAGLAEARLGAGIGYSPLLYVTIGSGIGGALIADGAIYRGSGLGAMEIGHMQVPDWPETEPSSSACSISVAGCRLFELQSIASGWGITRLAREKAQMLARHGRSSWIVLDTAGGSIESIAVMHIAQAALGGDEIAGAILDRARRALAFALRQSIILLAPRRIILGGGVSLIGEAQWFAPLRQLVDADVFPPFRGTYDIVPTTLGEEVVVHGALLLAQDVVRRGL